MIVDTQEMLSKVLTKINGWIDTAITMLPNFAVAVLELVVFYFIARIARAGVNKLSHRIQGNDAILKLLGTIVFLSILGLGIFAALTTLNLDRTVTSLLAGAGIIGLALGFAFQETAANFLSGFLMAFRKPFNIGDCIETGDHIGHVTVLDLRATIIKTFQGQEVIIPNKNVYYNPIKNYTKTPGRRIDLEVGVSYGEDLRMVKDLTVKAVEKIEGLDKHREVGFWYTGFGNSSIDFVLAIWLSSNSHSNYLLKRSEAIMLIKEAFDENGITIPFPIRTLDFGIKGGEKLDEMKLKMEQVNSGSSVNGDNADKQA